MTWIEQMRIGSACVGVRSENPLDQIDQAHRRKLALCDTLEEIADRLPNPDRVMCMQAAAQLTIEAPVHHADEDLGLFPLLRMRCPQEDRIEPVIDRLKDEHLDDEAAIEEVATLLRTYAAGQEPSTSATGVGYALRGFFEGQRRHVAWEEATVIPLARLRLSKTDLHRLLGIMARNRCGARPSALQRANAHRATIAKAPY